MSSKDSIVKMNITDEDAYAEELYKDLILSCSKHVKVKDIKLIRKAFNGGFKAYTWSSNIKDRLWRLKRDKNISSIFHLIKGMDAYFFL